MDKTILERVAKAAQPGDTLVLRFARTAVGDLPYLYGMHKHGFLEIARRDYPAVLAVLETREWGGDWNRTIHVSVQENFQENLDWFVGRMTRQLETITLTKKSETKKSDELPQAQPSKAIRQKEPERLHYRVTDKEKAPWHSNGERPTAWTFGQDQDENSIATALKKAGLI